MKLINKSNHLILSIILLICLPALAMAETIEGEFSRNIIDRTDGTAEVAYSIETSKEYIISLNVSSLRKGGIPKPGDIIKAYGSYSGEDLFIVTGYEEASPLTKNRILGLRLKTSQFAKTDNSKRSIFFFRTADSDCSKSAITDIGKNMISKSKNLSSGSFQFDSDPNQDGLPDIYTVDFPTDENCSFNKYKSNSSKFLNHLIEKNKTLNYSTNYSIVLFTKFNPECNYLGAADTPGTFTLMNSCSFGTVMHEIGHNQGLSHAGKDANHNGKIDSESEVYGDNSSFMGNSYSRDMHNSLQSYKLGWLDAQTESYDITYPNQSIHEVVEISNASDIFKPRVQTKLVRIKKGSRTYYVSYYKDKNDQHLLQVHIDGSDSPVDIPEDSTNFTFFTPGSLALHSIKERQSVAFETNFWITFIKRKNGVVTFKVSDEKPEGFAPGIGQEPSWSSPYNAFANTENLVTAHVSEGGIGLIYPTSDQNTPIIQVTNYSKVGLYYPSGRAVKKTIREIPFNNYGTYRVNLPGSKSALTENIGEVIKFTGNSILGKFLSIRDTSIKLKIHGARTSVGRGTNSEFYLDVDEEKMYFKLKILNDQTAELTYSPTSLYPRSSNTQISYPQGPNNSSNCNDPFLTELERFACERFQNSLPNENQLDQSNCVDDDGDGWGWNGIASCQVTKPSIAPAQTSSECIDDDKDGWGWNGTESCRVEQSNLYGSGSWSGANEGNNQIQQNESTTNQASCIDDDGDGWGWNGIESCRVEQSNLYKSDNWSSLNVGDQQGDSTTNEEPCVDNDGDGWGWNGIESCRVE